MADNKENKGILFKNDYKKSEKHPDFKGSINVDGINKDLSVWINEKDGKQYWSITASEPYVKPTANVTAKEYANTTKTVSEVDDNSLPF